MLDVHAPDHKIGGVSDFLVHLLTITAGLLIALALEGSVEAMHHRHQRKEAEALIREELTSNRRKIHDGAADLQTEIAAMTSLLAMLDARSEGKPATMPDKNDLQFREGPIQDSAWRTASTTGVLAYMPYEDVERFSDAYKEQDQLRGMEELALNDYLQLVPILRSHGMDLSPELAKEALPYARAAIGHLSGIYFIGIGTLGAYDEALK